MGSALRCIAMLAALLFAASSAYAQQEAPIMGSQSSPIEQDAPAVDETYRILVIGDSLAGGLGAGLSRVVDGNDQFEVANRFQEVSGVARPEVYDWSETLPKLMADKAFNAVVVLIGSNDRQEIRRDNFRFAFNNADWIKAYQQQTDRILSVLNGSGVKIFWIALPPMGDVRYDADMQTIAELQRQRAEAGGAIYIDLRKAFVDADGNYAARGEDDTGSVRNLRDSDGIAFTKAGNTKFGALVLEEIKRRIEGKTDLPMTTLSDPPLVVAPDAAGPIFGDGSQQGQAMAARVPVRQTGRVAASTPVLTGTPIGAGDLIPGSAAEQLYVQGIMAPAPAGRFDDFRLPAAAE